MKTEEQIKLEKIDKLINDEVSCFTMNGDYVEPDLLNFVQKLNSILINKKEKVKWK